MKIKQLGIALLLTAAASAQAPDTAPRFEMILRHGTVIDGSGLPRYRADVAVVNGYIARVGDLSKASAAVDIDVTGLLVTPGCLIFIARTFAR